MTLIYPEPKKECIIKPFKKDSLDAIYGTVKKFLEELEMDLTLWVNPYIIFKKHLIFPFLMISNMIWKKESKLL